MIADLPTADTSHATGLKRVARAASRHERARPRCASSEAAPRHPADIGPLTLTQAIARLQRENAALAGFARSIDAMV